MTDAALAHLAQSYADRLNALGAEQTSDLLAEVSVETPWWDERSNLFSMAATDPLDEALVLSTEPGSDDYVVVRWAGRWLVDEAPVDWSELERRAFEDD